MQPSLREFTHEGRFECGLDSVLKDKGVKPGTWAFIAVIGEDYGARLGVAVANENGYVPIPEHWAHADSLDDLEEHAQTLNALEGIGPRTAAMIMVSTMGGKRFVPNAEYPAHV